MNRSQIISRLLAAGFTVPPDKPVGFRGDSRLDPPASWQVGRASVYVMDNRLSATGSRRPYTNPRSLRPRLEKIHPASSYESSGDDHDKAALWQNGALLALLDKLPGSQREAGSPPVRPKS